MSETTKELAEADVSAQRVARVYAEALLSVGWARHCAQDFLESLEDLVHSILTPHPELEAFLSGRGVDRERKAAAIRHAFSGNARDDFVDFLLVLNDHGRLELIRPILAEFRQLYDNRLNRVRVIVTSAVPLDEGQRGRLVEELKGLARQPQEPILETRVDPDLIGGLVVRVGDYEYDGSVRTQLVLLQDYLIERSSHEIKRG
jgi:F-type H+-transporting ATPase subunit delta